VASLRTEVMRIRRPPAWVLAITFAASRDHAGLDTDWLGASPASLRLLAVLIRSFHRTSSRSVHWRR